jgi:hypothetical protein
MLSLYLLALCTNRKSMVVILSPMCIVPRFIINWLILCCYMCLGLFASSHQLSLKVSWHLCFALNMKDYLIATYATADYMWGDKHVLKALLFMIFLFVYLLMPWQCLLSSFDKIYILHDLFRSFFSSQITMLCLWMFEIVIACHLKNYSFYHLPTRGRAGVKLGDVDTSQTYL